MSTSTRPLPATRRVLLGLVSLLLVAGGVLTGAVPAQADEPTKVLLLLDVSGSMNSKISGGGTKFAAAKRALEQVAASLPSGTQVGLRVYGSKISEPRSKNPKACTDTRLVLPIGPLDRTRMDAAVNSFSAKGETPIAYSMGKAVDDLGDSGKRVLILISDGEETCGGDPCPVARKLADRGVDLQFNAIGLAVGAKARSQLQCIAKAGRGAYYDTKDTDSLGQALRKLTQRALRPFEVSGTPVKATTRRADAPVIGAGQYRDSYDTSGTPRYYTIERTPGSLVTASIATVVRQLNGAANYERVDLTLTTLDGQECSNTTRPSGAEYAAAVYGAAVRSAGSQSTPRPPRGCAEDPQLRLTMNRTSSSGGGGTVPVELLVTEQAPVTNRDALPESVADYDGRGKAVATTSPVRRAAGGSGFSNAAEIGAGTWSDSVAFGETVLYRVHLDYGQTLRATATIPGGGRRPFRSPFEQWFTRLAVASPARVTLIEQQQSGAGDRPVTKLTATSPQVRVRNDELALPLTEIPSSPDASTASVAGDYFVSVELEPVASPQLKGVTMPVQLNVAVAGTPHGQPVLDQAGTPTATPSAPPATTTPSTPPPSTGPTDQDARATSPALLVGLGAGAALILVAAGAALGLLLRRRKHRSAPPGA